MVLNYAEAYQAAVDEQYASERKSQALWNTANNSKFDWAGPNSIKVSMMDIKGGRRNRKRNTIDGVKSADYSLDWETYKLSFDRDWEVSVDPSDVDDTNGIATIVKVTDEFNRTVKVKEQDKYMFSKLYQEKLQRDKTGNGLVEKELTPENILEVFDDLMVQMDEASVTGTRTLYVTNPVRRILKQAETLGRYPVINADNGAINRTVYSLDDVNIVSVPSELMKTDYDFDNDGVVKAGAKQIQMFLIAEGVHIAPSKYNFVGFQEPATLTKGNYLYYEREFSDVFILQNKVAGYAAVTAPDKAATGNNNQGK